MWIIRSFLTALIVICIIAFALYNVGPAQKVDVHLVWADYLDVPLVTVVFWAFVAGVLFSLVLFASVYIHLSMTTRELKGRIRALEGEASVLRNRPIEDSADMFKKQATTTFEPTDDIREVF